MTIVVVASLGLIVGGPPLAALASLISVIWRKQGRSTPPPGRRLVLAVLMVELRSGASVLGSLARAAELLPQFPGLRAVSRIAAIEGLAAASLVSPPVLKPVLAHLLRAQVTGASLVEAVTRMLDEDVAAERSRRLARARALPIRLMLPITLLMLPGLVLLLYAPSLFDMFRSLSSAWP